MELDIDHGLIDLHVTFNGEDVFDAPVYLFTESGNYLGRYERTDYYGHVEFLIPAKSYKFRVDYEGTQYWSDVVTIIPHEENNIELNLDQLALNLTNDPDPVRFDGKPPAFKGEEIRLASIGSLIGILSQTVVANTSSPRVYYYLNDHLGTPQIITDEDGEVVWKAEYKPFGEDSVDPASITTNNFRFPGQYYDTETGLHYNYHRYYDPMTGRYITPDPNHSVQPRGTNIPYLLLSLLTTPNELNLYPYVSNNPIIFMDPLGLCNEVKRHFFEAGTWTDNTEFSALLGQTVWITVENVNPLATNIIIDSIRNYMDSTYSDVVRQYSGLIYTKEVEFKFSEFGLQPIYWNFRVSTKAPVFSVKYTIESTWVPGMPPEY